MRSDFSDHTPTDPGSIGAAVRQEARRGIKKLVPALVVLLVAVFTYWTIRVTVATEDARDAAGAGKQAAAKTKEEVSASYDDVKEKTESSGDTLAEAIERLNKLEAEVERLKARAERRPRRRIEPLKVPPAVTKDLPPTPAAAAAQDAQP